MNHNLKEHIVIAGGNGFIGKSLQSFLKKKNVPFIILSRDPQTKNSVFWDGKNSGEWITSIENARAIVNVTGKSINCRLTQKNKNAILGSRLHPIAALSDGIRACKNPPKIWIQASSVGIYPNTYSEICDEASQSGTDFYADVCKAWEASFLNLDIPDMRKVVLRIGWVLGEEGGVLEPLIKLTKQGMGGQVGSGRQMISWIHQDDLNQLIYNCVYSNQYQGIYNTVSPNPVSNQYFMKALRRQFKIKIGPPIPKPFVYLGALFLGTSASLAFSSKNCISHNLQNQNFLFQYEKLEAAFNALFN